MKYGAVLRLPEGPFLVTWDGKIIVGSEEDMRWFGGALLHQLVPISLRSNVPTVDIRDHAPALFERIDRKNGKSTQGN